mgnify:CR=1 FL=1
MIWSILRGLFAGTKPAPPPRATPAQTEAFLRKVMACEPATEIVGGFGITEEPGYYFDRDMVLRDQLGVVVAVFDARCIARETVRDFVLDRLCRRLIDPEARRS